MTDRVDIAVIGAGAAGLAAGIFAGETARASGRPLRICLLDGARTIGTKILVSGGGRCNVTHDVVTAADFNGAQSIVRNILAAFDEQAVVRWFSSLGVPLKREPTGKLFPTSDKARTVLDALLRRCTDLGVDVCPGRRACAVTCVAECTGGFRISLAEGELHARRVVMATGGRSLPRSGSDGLGWSIVQGLGHNVTETLPALVPLLLAEDFFHARLSGLSHAAELSTYAAGKLVDRRNGSLLWTHFGISGPVAMDASRHWLAAGAAATQPVLLRCNFQPGEDFASAERRLIEAAGTRPRAGVTTVLAGTLPARLAAALIAWCAIDPATPMGQLTREQRRALTHALTALPLPVLRDRGWNHAEVTAGGVPLNEIDRRTMQSRHVPGLYLVGEMLDCDGRIGGFNFQWAWSTGHLAGRAAARSF